MKLREVTEGSVFCIEQNRLNSTGACAYPKLKTKDGYIDIRDEIIKQNPPNWNVEIVPLDELYTDFETRFMLNKNHVDELLDSLKESVNN